MAYLIWLGLFLPLIGFLVLMSTSSVINRRLTNIVGCTTIFLSFACFATLLAVYTYYQMDARSFPLFQWIAIREIQADFALYLDPLSLLMTLIITGIGFLIHVYSIGYMEHEEDFARYFACLNFFVFAMLLLVLSQHLLALFVGWEGVGLASYLLIGYWYSRPAAAKAATKAFVVNRIGDLGLLLGLILTFYLFGTSDIIKVSQQAEQHFAVGAPIITVLTLLYFIGAIGKSAQLPLQTWLPDAMEGPTPVSALIHAATMVTAGVYLVVRMHDVFMLAPHTLYIIGIVGGATALYAALCALGQTDLKRVLAYSTVSQLGFMFLACGIGAFYAAMFHLTTHAFIKALLFLSAGNVVHMMHGSTDMNKMGGLSKKLPLTNWLFLIGVLALSGIPPLAAFFSKELILEEEYEAGYQLLFAVALIASILTAFYLTRAYCLAFTGAPRLEPKILKMVKEAPRVMLLPLLILAFFSILGGFLGFAFGRMPILEGFLAKADVTLPGNEFSGNFLWSSETLLAILGALAGLITAAVAYTKYQDKLGKTITVLRKAFYIDEIYDTLFVKPLEGFSRFIANVFEPKITSGSIDWAAQGTQRASSLLQKMQSGQVRSYAAWMVLGSVLLIAYLVL